MRYNLVFPLLAGLSLVDGQLDMQSASDVPLPAPVSTTNVNPPPDNVLASQATSITESLNKAFQATATGDDLPTSASVPVNTPTKKPGGGIITKKPSITKKPPGKPTKKPAKPTKKPTKKPPPKKPAKKPAKKVAQKKPAPKKPAPKKGKKHGRDAEPAAESESDAEPAPIAVLEKRAGSGPTSGCTQLAPILLTPKYTPSGDTGNPTNGTIFQLDPNFKTAAANEIIPPAGYTTSFTGLINALFSTNYVGYVQLTAYDPDLCAAYCNAAAACNAFNIYYERTPQYVPNANCPNPSPFAAVTCAMWGDPVSSSTAQNGGQYKNDFMVVISGSNGYNQNPTPASATNYAAPVPLYGAINPNAAGVGYLTYSTYNSYDPSQCANACNAYTANARSKASSSGTYTPCNYFNTFNVTYNGGFYVMYCSLYSTALGQPAQSNTLSAAATLQTSGQFGLVYSQGYALYPPDTGSKAVNWQPAPTGTAASCNSLGSVGSQITDYNKVTYTLGCGYDVQYFGDIGNATAPDFYSCFNLCDNFQGCNAFTYLGTQCYFKNLAGSSRTPQPAGSSVNMAWTGAYAGFSASTIAATVVYTTYTTAWTGAGTVTTTTQSGLTNYVIVQTPGGKATSTTATTVYTDSGTASTIGTNSNVAAGTTTYTVVYPTPSCSSISGKANAGARFGFYTNNAAGGQGPSGYPSYTPTTVSSQKPFASGIASYIAYSNSGSQSSLTVYGVNNVNTANLVISHTFYLYAGRGTGYYSFTIPYCDDIEFVWIGNTALSGWTRQNANLFQFWSSAISTQTPQTLAYYLTFGSYLPIRIQFGNGGGAGDMRFQVQAPDGSYIVNSTPGGNSGAMYAGIVGQPCQSSQGAAFTDF